jgi:hypothetical protein
MHLPLHASHAGCITFSGNAPMLCLWVPCLTCSCSSCPPVAPTYAHCCNTPDSTAVWRWALCATLSTIANAASTHCCLVQGVRYTHRSNFVHSCLVVMPDALCLGAGSTVLMVVPMFHANSWGLNFAGEAVHTGV